MNEGFIKESLAMQGLPNYDSDIPFIKQTLHTVNQAKIPLKQFPDLKTEVPITIVDKELMR